MSHNQFDIHLHSSFSDGSESPESVLRIARRAGLFLVSITDHNTLKHLIPTEKLAAKLKIRSIPGVEIGTSYKNHELHILGYCFDRNNKTIKKLFADLKTKRDREVNTILAKLKILGFSVPRQKISGLSVQYLGLSHIIHILLGDKKHKKRILSELGTTDIFEIINKYFSPGKPAYVPEKFPGSLSVIRAIRRAGGFAVLAHPGFHLSFKEDRVIKDLAAAGLEGLEVFTPKHNWQQIVHYELLAKKLGLIITSGSDYHSRIHKVIPLASPIGYLKIPAQTYNSFVHYLKRNKNCRIKF